ncbi:hypothetical protein JHD50_02785 [Sulfurimonas sp. MAG313]|nr:hypothetical protein [Sulfurimonas sp. MAG313]MDF1880237.1 hypothetical protein [Sulfurimonas sp. MAG313]
MKISHQFDIKVGVHTLQLMKDKTLCVIDINNNFRVYDLDKFKLKDGFKSNLPKNILYIDNMAISSDANYLSFYDTSKKEISIFDRTKRNFIYTICSHAGGVETVEFTKDNKYLITGGMEGRLYMWSAQSGKKVDTLSHHHDSISAISSNDNSRWVATAGYDKVIKVFNRSFRKNHYKLISHQEPITSLNFLSGQRLLSTDKEGSILIWDIIKCTVIQRLPSFDAHITAVSFDKEEQFLFVASLSGMVGLYDLQEGTLLKNDFLKQLAGISQMQYCDERNFLVFGLSNGHIPIFELDEPVQEFTKLMKEKDFQACYLMSEENPMILYTPVYESLENLYSKAFEHAVKLLREQKTKAAKDLLRHFSASSSKRLQIQKLFNDFSMFNTFLTAVKSKKYMMAYSLVAQYSSLKDTPEYAMMEKQWSKILLVVKKIINDKDAEEKIKQLFKPFMGIPGKNLIITSLYSNRNVFVFFRKHLLDKDYFNAFKLIVGHPFLQEFEEYQNLVKIGKIYKEKTEEVYNNGEYYEAVKLCEILVYFPEEKEFAEGLREKANIYAEAMQYYAEKKFTAVYNMIEAHPYLEDAQITQDIEKGFLDYYEKSELYAADGNVSSVKKVMEKFSKIKSKVPSIVHLIKIGYWAQIEKAAQTNKSDMILLEAFSKYQKIFGYESMLEDLLKSIQEKRPLEVSFDVQGSKEYKGSISALADELI